MFASAWDWVKQAASNVWAFVKHAYSWLGMVLGVAASAVAHFVLGLI